MMIEGFLMISEIKLILGLIVGIVLMARWGLFHRLLPERLRLRIQDELRGRLKVSAPHLRSTFDGVGFDSGSSTSSAR